MNKVQKYYLATKGLLRVKTYFLLVLFCVVGYSFAVYQAPPGVVVSANIKLAVALVIIAGWYINATALNDFADYEIDKINIKKNNERPLLSKMLSRNEMIYIAFAAGMLAILLSSVLGLKAVWLTIIFIVLNAAYSLKPIAISHRGVLAIILLPLGYVLFPFVLGFWAAGYTVTLLGIGLIAGFHLQFLSRIVLKDFRDVKGDKKFGKKTFLLVFGKGVVCLTAQTALIIGFMLLVIVFYNQLKYSFAGLALLAGYAFQMLHLLSRQQSWQTQKAFISSYGRAQTGMLTIVGMTFFMLSLSMQLWQVILLCTLTGLVFLVSAQRTLELSIK